MFAELQFHQFVYIHPASSCDNSLLFDKLLVVPVGGRSSPEYCLCFVRFFWALDSMLLFLERLVVLFLIGLGQGFAVSVEVLYNSLMCLMLALAAAILFL